MESTIFQEYNIENIDSVISINESNINDSNKNIFQFNKFEKKIKNKINNLITRSENLMADINLLDNNAEPIIIETNIIPIVHEEISTNIKSKNIPFEKIEKVEKVNIIYDDFRNISKITNNITTIDIYTIDSTIIDSNIIDLDDISKKIYDDNKITFELKIKEKEKKNTVSKKIIDVNLIDYNLNIADYRYTKIVNLLYDKSIFLTFMDQYIKVNRKDRNKQKINKIKKNLFNK
jgi:hypothetical protein